jgi:SAM-dependent methyltransferase
VDRDEHIICACEGRDVFHLGATDSPMTRDKARRGALLHQKLAGHCKRLTGFDIDKGAIDLLRDEYGIDNIRLCDLEQDIPREAGKAQVLVNGDIVEHVSSPGRLMSACNRLLETEGIMLLSSVNALSLKQAIRGFCGREPVHPQHVAYYSYATLGVLGGRFGFRAIDCRFFPYACVTRTARAAFAFLYRIAPAVADGVCVTFQKVRDV